MALNGSNVLISVLTDDDPTDVYTVIPCQTSGEYSLSVGMMDTSCKDTEDAQNEPAIRSRSISVETIPGAWPTLTDTPTTAEQILRNAAETGSQVQGRILAEGTAVESFTGTITSYSLSAPQQDATTCSIEIEISGAMVPIP